MCRRQCWAMLFLGFLTGGMTMGFAAGDEPTGQRPARFEKEVPVTMDYLLFLPAGYQERDRWPLLVFLHGAGERGQDLELVKKHGPPKIVAAKPDFPFIVVSPQCPANRWWDPFALAALVDEVVAKYKVDPDRVYLTGLSMGGYGTWALAAREPDRFAALVPICGGGERSWARRLRQLPIWVFHGAKDNVVPVQQSEEMVEALKQAGGNVEFTLYPEAGHDSWTETYDNPQLYEWLLAQKRAASP